MQLVDAAIHHAATGAELVRARALRIREASGRPCPTRTRCGARCSCPRGHRRHRRPACPSEPALETDVAFHQDAIDLRFVEGMWNEPGPVTMWGRLLVPLVAGEEPSPLQRTAALSDMGNGVSGVVGFDTHMFINPELTIHLWRVPAGEWIALRCRSDLGRRGVGLAKSALYDTDGLFGRAAQSLFVDTR